MRIPFLIVALAIPSCVFAGAIKPVRVWPGYRTEESFERISEFLGGGEHKNTEVLLRTQADSRAGYYFFARFHNPDAAVSQASVELSVLYPNETKARVFRNFPAISLSRGDTVLNVGLTGSDWAGAKQTPIAWQLRLLSAEGTELSKEQSFLWH